MISPESAVNIEPVLDTPVIETIDVEKVKTEEISTALPTAEPAESIIEPDNVIEDLPVVEAEPEIVDDVKTNYVQISIPKRKKNQVKVAFSVV